MEDYKQGIEQDDVRWFDIIGTGGKFLLVLIGVWKNRVFMLY